MTRLSPDFRMRMLAAVAFGAAMAGAYGVGIGLPAKGHFDPISVVVGMILAFAGVLGFAAAQRARRARTSAVEAAVCVVAVTLAVCIVNPVFISAKVAAVRTSCLTNLKHLATANHLYATDNNEHLPSANAWQSLTDRYRKSFPSCGLSKTKFSYGFNDAASGLNLSETSNSQAVMLFEMDSELPNAHGVSSQAASRHGSTYASRIDGSGTHRNLDWNPKGEPR